METRLNTITLLRLELPSTLGMYGSSGNEESPAYAVFGEDAKNHKPPHKDKKLSKAARYAGANLSDYFYAFKNESQLLRWVNRQEWIEGLHERGVVVSEYICDKEDVLIGSYQCCFSASRERVSFSLLEYFAISDSTKCINDV